MKLTKLFIPILLTVFAFSEEPSLSKALGISGGLISGSGLSYRNIGVKNGYQVTFGIISLPYDNSGMRTMENHYQYTWYGDWTPDTSVVYKNYEYGYGGTWANCGVKYFRPLHRADKSTFYSYAGVSAYYSSSIDYYTEYKYFLNTSDSTYTYEDVSPRKKEVTTKTTFRIGAGIGIEYKLTENIRLALDLPITFADDGRITMILPEGGVYYYYR